MTTETRSRVDLYAELRSIVETLDRAGLRYALVGGVAVSIYAAPRATEDIDLLIPHEDLDPAIETLSPLGFRRAGEPMRVGEGRLLIQRLIKIEGRDLLPLDLLVPLDPALHPIASDRVSVPWEGARVWVVGLDGLRTLKRLRNSSQDRADLEALGPEPA